VSFGAFREGNAKNEGKMIIRIFLSPFTFQTISWLSFCLTISSQQEWSFFLLPQINGIVCGALLAQ
jgi:hypothetical protein